MANGTVKTIGINLAIFTKAFTPKIKEATTEVQTFGQRVRSALSPINLLKKGLSSVGPVASKTASVVKSASKTVASSMASIGKAGAKLGGIAGLIGGLAGVGGIGAGIGLGVKLAADTELATVSFTKLLGSTEAAQEKLKEIKEYGAKTPFSSEELRGSTQQLLAFSMTGEDAMSTLKRLGDISSGTGANIQELSGIVGKMFSKGKVETEGLDQLTERAVPIVDELAKNMGVSAAKVREMVSAGEIGFDQLNEALTTMTSNGGKFENAALDASKTLAGSWSTAVDNVKGVLEELAGTIIKSIDLTGIVNNITVWIGQAMEWFKEWKDVIGQFAKSAMAVLSAFGEMAVSIFKKVGNFVASVLGVDMTKSANDWKETLTDAFLTVEYYARNWQEALSLSVSKGKLAVVAFVNDVVHFFLNVLPKTWTSWASGTISFFWEVTKKIGSFFSELWDFISSGGKDKISVDLSSVTAGFSKAYDESKALMQREKGELEQSLLDEVNAKQAKFTEGLEAFKAEKKKADEKTAENIEKAVEQSATSEIDKMNEKKKEEDKDEKKQADPSSILQKGSVAAYQAILNARNKQASPEVAAINKTTKETKKVAEELKDIKKNQNKLEIVWI